MRLDEGPCHVAICFAGRRPGKVSEAQVLKAQQLLRVGDVHDG